MLREISLPLGFVPLEAKTERSSSACSGISRSCATPLQFLEYRAIKNPHSVSEVNKMLREIRLPLGFVPLEKHSLASPAKLLEYARSVHTLYDNTTALL